MHTTWMHTHMHAHTQTHTPVTYSVCVVEWHSFLSSYSAIHAYLLPHTFSFEQSFSTMSRHTVYMAQYLGATLITDMLLLVYYFILNIPYMLLLDMEQPVNHDSHIGRNTIHQNISWSQSRWSLCTPLTSKLWRGLRKKMKLSEPGRQIIKQWDLWQWVEHAKLFSDRLMD